MSSNRNRNRNANWSPPPAQPKFQPAPAATAQPRPATLPMPAAPAPTPQKQATLPQLREQRQLLERQIMATDDEIARMKDALQKKEDQRRGEALRLEQLDEQIRRLEEPPEVVAHRRRTLTKPLCNYYARGRCRNGANCRFSHYEPEDTHEGVCAVCLEDPRDTQESRGPAFALLSGCDHVFCIGCIKKWMSEKQQTGTGATCPLCRSKFKLFVMSSRPLMGDDRLLAVEVEIARRDSIPCRTFTSKGRCPMNSECFYRHPHHRSGVDQRPRQGPPIRMDDVLNAMMRTILQVNTSFAGRQGSWADWNEDGFASSDEYYFEDDGFPTYDDYRGLIPPFYDGSDE